MDPDSLTRLGEYGVAGILMIVIVSVMSLLLRHMLTQASNDRKEWKDQSDRFLSVLDSISRNQLETSLTIRGIADSIESLRYEFDKWRK